MFTDKIKMTLKSGDGGNGSVSFRREKYVPNGGPDGGDGGVGGCVVIEAAGNMASLSDYKNIRYLKAENGLHGAGKNRSGKKGEDLMVKVPRGTVIKDVNGRVIYDFSRDGQQFTLLNGGRGGWGNQHFATAVRQAPRYAKNGAPGKELEIVFELKLIADVGLIGFPNAGKSTLLKMATNANPRIADYHFTTLSPNLGVVRSVWGREFVLADIPGLIEGASEGLGLGHEFLRHIERTKVLIHVVDAAGLEGDEPVGMIKKINRELELYNPELLNRPQIIAANKMDLPDAEDNYRLIKKYCETLNIPSYPVSAATNIGIDILLKHAFETLETCPDNVTFNSEPVEYGVEMEEPETTNIFTIELTEGVFYVKGLGIEKMMGYTNIESEDGFAFFQKYLRDRGVIKRLEEMNVAEGDTISISGLEFDYYK